MKQKATYNPLFIAHRGAKREAPENTLTAFKQALTYPEIVGIELDVQLSKEEVPVLFHNKTLWKLLHQKKRINQYPLHELQKIVLTSLNNSYQERIPTLREILKKTIHKTSLYIEIKTSSTHTLTKDSQKLTDKVIEQLSLITKAKKAQPFFILTFDRSVIQYAHALKPQWNYVLNVTEPKYLSPQDLKMLPYLYGICTNINKLTPAFAKKIKQQNKKLITYTSNTNKQLQHALECKTDIILTDDPAWLFQSKTYLDFKSKNKGQKNE